jgi:pyruvate/2-oxoglutarate dehydrogenase complex dihydrolipoamide acyltransferase (E2) component
MAESISEGTLKQFSKQVGDYVEADEEIATIETDKVCFSPYCSLRARADANRA